MERRLRPIYEWLDSGNNKKAVQEADKVLRKQPTQQCARVLKGLALLRLARPAQCRALLQEVVREAPADEPTLQALTICYREMHQPKEICKVYENAVRAEPSNEELLSQLFMSYVRVGDYRSQQQTAMKLYKLKPKNPYYFWAVMSHVMQAHKSSDAKGKEVSLLLAERMVKNFVKSGKIEAEAEVMTYLHILETQGKYEEALSVLDGPLASKVIHQPENFLLLRRGTYHIRLEQWEAAAGVYRDLILKEPDNWQHYVEYVTAVIKMAETRHTDTHTGNHTDTHAKNHTDTPNNEQNQTSIEVHIDRQSTTNTDTHTHNNTNAHTPVHTRIHVHTDPLVEAAVFLGGVRKARLAGGARKGERAPLLGLLELARGLKKANMEHRIPELCGDIADLLLSHIQLYGDKMCCYGDIVLFLPLLLQPGEEQGGAVAKVLEGARKMCRQDERDVPLDIESVYRDLTHHQLSISLGQHEGLSAAQHIAFADSLRNKYELTKGLTSNMADTDIRPEDPYLILATHSYLKAINLASSSSSSSSSPSSSSSSPCQLVIQVAAMLESGIERSKANFQLKLLLIKVYNMLGATGASHVIYDRCDLKHIQLDTLGHVLGLQAVETASYTTAQAVFGATLKFFMANYKDTSDPLISSYKYGSLTRIPEFVDFRERLNDSLHFATITSEQMFLELTAEVCAHGQAVEAVSELSIRPAHDTTPWEDLKDNRDLTVMDSWEPPHRRLSKEDIQASVRADIALLRIRNLILRLMGAACLLSHPPSPPNNALASHNKENSGDCLNGEDCGSGGGGGGSEEMLDDLTKRLQEEYDATSSSYANNAKVEYPLQGPDPPRVYVYMAGEYVPLLLGHARLLRQVHGYTRASQATDHRDTRWDNDTLKHLLSLLDSTFAVHLRFLESVLPHPPATPPYHNPPLLASLHHLAQTAGLAAIFLGCCVGLLRPLKTQASKRSKKKKEQVAMPEVIPQLSYYLTAFTQHLEKMEKAIRNKTNKQKNSNSNDPPVTTEELQLEKTVCEKVEESLMTSLQSLAHSYSCKMKYMGSLKL